MPHGKSPYELRADLLRLAFEILLAEHHAKAEKTFPSSEEVIEEARKLNEFISKEKSNFRN